VSNKNSIADTHPGANEGVALDPAFLPNCRPSLNFNECSNPGVVADGTSVEVRKLKNDNVIPQDDIVCDVHEPAVIEVLHLLLTLLIC
jgi:hypothetical protein